MPGRLDVTLNGWSYERSGRRYWFIDPPADALLFRVEAVVNGHRLYLDGNLSLRSFRHGIAKTVASLVGCGNGALEQEIRRDLNIVKIRLQLSLIGIDRDVEPEEAELVIRGLKGTKARDVARFVFRAGGQVFRRRPE